MERFDLSYRTLENREVSLVVERLPLDAPDYRAVWDRAFDEGMRELSMHFAMSSVPAGIPTWFIARQHRFTTHTHWRSGAVLRDREDRHVALVAVDSHRGTARLSARGPNPHDFFALLRDGFELTLARFPGLEVTRLIPCPGHLGQPCHHRFDYEHLLKAAHRQPPVVDIQCPLAFEFVPSPGLPSESTGRLATSSSTRSRMREQTWRSARARYLIRWIASVRL